jgi:hypothetical protein
VQEIHPFLSKALPMSGLESIPQQLRAALQHNEFCAQLVQHVGCGLGRKTPNSRAVQAGLVIDYARSHVLDLLLGSFDFMTTRHDERASSARRQRIAHPSAHYWILFNQRRNRRSRRSWTDPRIVPHHRRPSPSPRRGDALREE